MTERLVDRDGSEVRVLPVEPLADGRVLVQHLDDSRVEVVDPAELHTPDTN